MSTSTDTHLATDGDTSSKSFKHQPPSLYVVPAYYDWLMSASADLSAAIIRPQGTVSSEINEVIERLLRIESRLVDQQEFDQWISLFADECAYWIPSKSPAPDPRTSITLEFHDRRRLLDRIVRLQTGYAYSQAPRSRTARQWGGLEVWPSPDRSDEWCARYTFTLAESRNGINRLLAGWNGFVLRRAENGIQIAVKQVNLIDCDTAQGNNSFFL